MDTYVDDVGAPLPEDLATVADLLDKLGEADHTRHFAERSTPESIARRAIQEAAAPIIEEVTEEDNLELESPLLDDIGEQRIARSLEGSLPVDPEAAAEVLAHEDRVEMHYPASGTYSMHVSPDGTTYMVNGLIQAEGHRFDINPEDHRHPVSQEDLVRVVSAIRQFLE